MPGPRADDSRSAYALLRPSAPFGPKHGSAVSLVASLKDQAIGLPDIRQLEHLREQQQLLSRWSESVSMYRRRDT